ncbi:MAG: hypothetical protein IJ039_04425 [Clostridia bacterium]|nr:hypothetical protein [Clostridia bacterium]
MKRIFTLIILLLLIALTVSCTDTEHTETGSQNGSISSPDSIPDSSKHDEEKSDEEKNDASEPNEPPENNKVYFTKANTSISYEKNEYYSFLELGTYLGHDLSGVGSYFRILETYDEVVNLTTNGRYFNEEQLKDYYVVALYRYAGYSESGVIGYKDFNIFGDYASITLHSWSTDLYDVSPVERENIVYLRVPKSEIEIDKTIGGYVNVTDDGFYRYESTYVEVEKGKYKNNTSWVISHKNIDSFLEQNGITNLNWNMLGRYIRQSHTYIAVYMETVYPDSIGYGNLTVEGTTISIKREYESQNETSLKSVIELVAVPTEKLKTGIINVNICQTENSFKFIPSTPVVIKTQLTDEGSYNYYDFIDLGVYYYEEELRNNNAFHIITSYEELEKYTEKAYNLSNEFFKTNVVVVLKMNGIDILDVYGVRNIGFGSSAILQATIETGKSMYENLDSIKGPFQYNICYVSVPREDIYRNYYQNKGSLNVKKNNLSYFSNLYSDSFSPVDGYDVPLNSAWFLTSEKEIQSFYKETGIRISSLGSKLQIAYYGCLGENPYFYGFHSNEENIYMDVSYEKTEDTEPRFYIIEVDWSLIKCLGNVITIHLIKYEQTCASALPSEKEPLKINSSFFACGYNSTYLTNTPDFEWKLIQNSTELEQIIKGYTNIVEYKEIDFEKQLVIAHYYTEGCTGCPGSTHFGNVRVANKKMYVDKYVKNHWGGAAETSALYFIIVNRDEMTEEIEEIIFIKRHVFEEIEEELKHVIDRWEITVDSTPYEMQIISTIGISTDTPIKKKVDFDFKFIESKDSLLALLNEYTNVEAKKEFLELDFENQLIIALYQEEGGGAFVGGSFINLVIMDSNTLVINQYYPWDENDGEFDIASDDAIHPTIYLIAVEKNFDTSKIEEIQVMRSLYDREHKDFIED